MKPQLIMMVGNIGSGKSTQAAKYARDGFAVICRDSFRTMIGGGHYVFSPIHEIFINSSIDLLFRLFVKAHLNIVIDETNVSRERRQDKIEFAKKYGYEVIADVMPRLDRDTSVFRRLQDADRGQSAEKWLQVYDKFERRYQPPTKEEGFDAIRQAA